ncbi:hypothetical protein [Botrimarina mediterranea]|uniref:PEP-CTERM protein-sorting domain-containing protein n=1 Tax=Botrimarina mediterranea TaxID=2528022 RepID=A0A518K885_9BACT|nr:hypothetical protein [Botrimarina mediterranea]QDV74002.1 hypothetical protein Spa11_22010 [Botrimarina mediterranea]QDV78632.1 hypothetical protein K2D_22390 [Planctomycetes bacterium K2D]
MRQLTVCGIAAILSAVGLSAHAANLLVDPGFEDPASLTFDGAPFVGTWEGFNNGGANTTALSGTNPRTGASSLDLFLGDANGFAGAFQEVPAFEGAEVTFTGWHALATGSVAGGTEVRIEFVDAGGVEVGRTGNLAPSLTADGNYESFIQSGIAPAGTAGARAVYAIQSFGAGLTQNVFVDDLSMTVIPEPAAVLLALLGLAPLTRRRS